MESENNYIKTQDNRKMHVRIKEELDKDIQIENPEVVKAGNINDRLNGNIEDCCEFGNTSSAKNSETGTCLENIRKSHIPMKEEAPKFESYYFVEIKQEANEIPKGGLSTRNFMEQSNMMEDEAGVVNEVEKENVVEISVKDVTNGTLESRICLGDKISQFKNIHDDVSRKRVDENEINRSNVNSSPKKSLCMPSVNKNIDEDHSKWVTCVGAVAIPTKSSTSDINAGYNIYDKEVNVTEGVGTTVEEIKKENVVEITCKDVSYISYSSHNNKENDMRRLDLCEESLVVTDFVETKLENVGVESSDIANTSIEIKDEQIDDNILPPETIDLTVENNTEASEKAIRNIGSRNHINVSKTKKQTLLKDYFQPTYTGQKKNLKVKSCTKLCDSLTQSRRIVEKTNEAILNGERKLPEIQFKATQKRNRQSLDSEMVLAKKPKTEYLTSPHKKLTVHETREDLNTSLDIKNSDSEPNLSLEMLDLSSENNPEPFSKSIGENLTRLNGLQNMNITANENILPPCLTANIEPIKSLMNPNLALTIGVNPVGDSFDALSCLATPNNTSNMLIVVPTYNNYLMPIPTYNNFAPPFCLLNTPIIEPAGFVGRNTLDSRCNLDPKLTSPTETYLSCKSDSLNNQNMQTVDLADRSKSDVPITQDNNDKIYDRLHNGNGKGEEEDEPVVASVSNRDITNNSEKSYIIPNSEHNEYSVENSGKTLRKEKEVRSNRDPNLSTNIDENKCDLEFVKIECQNESENECKNDREFKNFKELQDSNVIVKEGEEVKIFGDVYIRIKSGYQMKKYSKLRETHIKIVKNVDVKNLNLYTEPEPEPVNQLTSEEVEEMVAMKCDKCDFKTLKGKKDLMLHSVIHNPKSTLYECSLCSFKGLCPNYFKRHMSTHSNAKNDTAFKCEKCIYKTIDSSNLKKHQRKHLTDEEKRALPDLTCDECTFVTKFQDILGKHKKFHKNPGEVRFYKCEHCPYYSRLGQSLKTHVLRIHLNQEEGTSGETLKCSQPNCGYTTMVKTNLRKHERKHVRSKDVLTEETISCYSCSYQTKCKRLLIKHIRCCHAKKKYSCTYCDFKVTNVSMFKDHLLRHKDPSECEFFGCPQCDYSTKIKHDLSSHVKRVHEKKRKRQAKKSVSK